MDNYEKIIYNELEKYPVLDNKEQLELVDRYKNNGDMESRQKLINHNLRLCLFVAKKYMSIVKSMTFMDLFNENVITLMKAIDLYKQEKGVKFSTYVISAMENNLKMEISNQDDTIRKPANLNILISKYHKFIDNYKEQYNREPTGEELKEQLQLSECQFNNIQNIIKNTSNLSSLDSIVGSDDDSLELINYISVENNDIDELINQYDLNILKNKCVKILTPEEYYIIYYRYLSDEKFTLEKIANEFGVTKGRICKRETTIKSKLKRRLHYIRENNIEHKERLDPLPLHYIIVLNELKQLLSKEEYFILYSIVYDKKNSQYIQISGLNSKQLVETKKYLSNIFNQFLKDENLEKLKNKYRKKYTIAQILELNIKVNYKELIDFQKLDCYFQSVDWTYIKESDYYKNLSISQKSLIDRYYKQNNGILVTRHIHQVEKELTLNKLGYIKKEKNLFSIKDLRKIYIKYEEFLTNKQRKNLNLVLFNKDNSHSFRQCEIENIINVLLKKEFRIDYFFQNQITLSQIKEVLNKNKGILSSRERDLIFKYYGIDTERLSINDIANKYGESYEKINDELSSLRQKLLKKYYNICEYKKDEFSEEDQILYKSYIENPQYEFSEEARKIFSIYLKGKNYEEISKITNLSRTIVSNIVTESIRKSEFYKYRILLPKIIKEEELEQTLEIGDYTDLERELIRKKFLYLKQPEELQKLYNINKRNISILNSKFYNEYLFFKCPKISIEEYERELMKYQTESILSEEEKRIVSLRYGIKSKYNLEGIVNKETELSKIFSISKKAVLERIKNIENKVREMNIGFLQPKYGIISRKELMQILEDKNLPISEKERNILCSINELNGYLYKTEKELAEEYNERSFSIKRRYDRAILAIKKYQDKKIQKQISYENDIKGIEKYFSEYDRKLLVLYYKNKMTNEQIGKELNLNYNQVQKQIVKLRIDVSEVLNDELTAKKFDFNYAREVLENEDLPLYYNNNKLAIKIYQMLSGELGNKKYTQSEVINELQLDIKGSITNIFYNVLFAVEKYKRGVRKQKMIDINQVMSFYKENESNLYGKTKISFQRLIKKEAKKDSLLSLQKRVSSSVIYEIIKNTDSGCIKITSIKRDDAIKILSNRNLILTSSCRRNIKNYFQIPERDLMNGKDKMKALKILSPLYNKIFTNKSINSLEKSLKKIK